MSIKWWCIIIIIANFNRLWPTLLIEITIGIFGSINKTKSKFTLCFLNDILSPINPINEDILFYLILF